MSMKKTDLVRNLNARITGQMKGAGVPDRFAQGAADASTKREQRRRDADAGLVPFACKLPSALLERLRAQASARDGDINAVVAELLEKSLG